MTGTSPEAVVVVPHFEDEARLKRCLQALAPQLSERVALVVVDNGSRRDPAHLLSGIANARRVIEPASGAAAARNRGVAESSAPWIFFLDCDCCPAADWVVQALRLGPGGGAGTDLAGGSIRIFDETPLPRSGTQAFEAVFAFDQESYIKKKRFSVTANLIVPRAAFLATGAFRGGVSEDLDWCHRALARGYTLSYAPDLVVAHPSRSDWAALRRKWRRLTEESFGLRGYGARARLIWLARSAAVLGSAPVHALRILRAPQLQPGEKLRALGVLVRLRLLRARWMVEQAAGWPVR